MTIFDEPTVIVTQSRGLPGTGMTEPRAAQIEADIDTILALPTITTLNSLSDVNTSGVADGNVLIYESSAAAGDKWQPGSPATAIDIYRDTAGATFVGPANRLDFEPGIFAEDVGGATRKKIYIQFAGTGSAATSSRSDHTHTAAVIGIDAGAATGLLSSGTRTIASTTTGTLASGITYDIKGTAIIRARNNVSSGTMNLIFRVGSSGSYLQRVRLVQTVGGVPVDQIINFVAILVGAGTGEAVLFQVQFVSGDAVDLRDHEVIVECHPRR